MPQGVNCPVHGTGYGRCLGCLIDNLYGIRHLLRDIPWEPQPRPDYLTYLRSPEWRRIRHRKFVQQDNRCERCGNLGHDVHHLHYRTLGRENLSDLQLLCRPCHEAAHETKAA